jgi:HEAT repeat protein
MAFVDQAFEDPRSRPALLERLLHGGDDAPVREGLAVRLAATGSNWDAFVPRLLAVEPDPGVRVVLVWTLRGASGAQAVSALAAALVDESPRVRAQAARNSGYLNESSAIEPALISTLSDLDPAVRAAAARSLGWLESSEAAVALELLLADRTSEVRLRALRALSRIDPARAGLWDRLPTLEQDPDSRVARLARRLTQTRP